MGTDLIRISRLKVAVPTGAHPLLAQSRPALKLAKGRRDGHVHCGGQLAHAVVASCIPLNTAQQQLGLQVCAIARLEDLLRYLAQHAVPGLADAHQRVQAYRERYGVSVSSA